MDEMMWLGLKDLFLFQLLTREEMADLAGLFGEKTYKPGETVFYEKDKGETMYVIKSGSIKIAKHEGSEMKEIITYTQGDFFGEIALFEYALRTASAIAQEDTVLLEVTRIDFNRFFSQKPHIVAKLLYQMMIEMSRRLRRKNIPDGGVIF